MNKIKLNGESYVKLSFVKEMLSDLKGNLDSQKSSVITKSLAEAKKMYWVGFLDACFEVAKDAGEGRDFFRKKQEGKIDVHIQENSILFEHEVVIKYTPPSYEHEEEEYTTMETFCKINLKGNKKSLSEIILNEITNY